MVDFDRDRDIEFAVMDRPASEISNFKLYKEISPVRELILRSVGENLGLPFKNDKNTSVKMNVRL